MRPARGPWARGAYHTPSLPVPDSPPAPQVSVEDESGITALHESAYLSDIRYLDNLLSRSTQAVANTPYAAPRLTGRPTAVLVMDADDASDLVVQGVEAAEVDDWTPVPLPPVAKRRKKRRTADTAAAEAHFAAHGGVRGSTPQRRLGDTTGRRRGRSRTVLQSIAE